MTRSMKIMNMNQTLGISFAADPGICKEFTKGEEKILFDQEKHETNSIEIYCLDNWVKTNEGDIANFNLI